MKVKVQAPFHVNMPLKALIDEKIDKLTALFERITSAEVFLKKEENRHKTPEGKTVEIRVNVPRQVLFSTDVSDNYEKALAGAAEKMRKQLLKYKNQLSPKHG